jgi:hypothetical protein
MKNLLLGACLLAALGTAASAQPWDDPSGRSPIIYNLKGQEVAVIQRPTERGGEPGYIVQPTQKYLGLGYYDIAIPASTLRPRARGGWLTNITNDEFPFIPPTPPRFFRPSGV